MSEIVKTIKADFLAARKARDASTAAFLSAIIGTIEQSTMTAKGREELTDDHAIVVLKSYLKKNAELLEIPNLSENAKELAATEKSIVERYLPTQLTEQAIRDIFTEIDHSNLGLMMKHLKDNYAGLYDGKVASAVAREFV